MQDGASAQSRPTPVKCGWFAPRSWSRPPEGWPCRSRHRPRRYAARHRPQNGCSGPSPWRLLLGAAGAFVKLAFRGSKLQFCKPELRLTKTIRKRGRRRHEGKTQRMLSPRFMVTIENGEPAEYALVDDENLWVSFGRRPDRKRQRWPDKVVTERDVISGVNRWGRKTGEDAVVYLRHAARMHELHKRWGVRGAWP